MKVNRKYKDCLFTTLFSNQATLIDLYNALSEKQYSKDTPLEIITLEDVLFMERKNDICFLLENHFVVLMEHQSTINENMPFRFLLYVAREYEKILDNNLFYRRRLVKIPTPEFFVFYNGSTGFPERQTLRLSDAFEQKQDSPKLELIADVININYGKNSAVMQKCKLLKQYSYLIAVIRSEQQQHHNLEIAITNAIKHCIDNNILKDFLIKNGSEVINMLKMEFNLDDARAVWKEEDKAEGIEIGMDALGTLIELLLRDNKIEEARKAATDAKYRNELLKQYGLLNKS